MVGERAGSHSRRQLGCRAGLDSEFQARATRTTLARPVSHGKGSAKPIQKTASTGSAARLSTAPILPLPEQPSGPRGHEGHRTNQQEQSDEGAVRDTGRPRAAVHLEQAEEAGELTGSQKVDRDGHGGQSEPEGVHPHHDRRGPRPSRRHHRGRLRQYSALLGRDPRRGRVRRNPSRAALGSSASGPIHEDTLGHRVELPFGAMTGRPSNGGDRWPRGGGSSMMASCPIRHAPILRTTSP